MFPFGLILTITGSVVLIIGMIVAGAIMIALSCGCVFGCRYRSAQQYEEWALAHPDAARAFEARGGYEAVPYIILPEAVAQQTPSVQVIVVQSNPAAGDSPDYSASPGPLAQPEAAAAPIVENGILVYPELVPPVPAAAGGTNIVTVVGQPAAARTKYFYKPEFRGQRLTPEQMAPGGAAQVAAAKLQAQQQQATTMMVQPGVVTGRPVMAAWAPTGPNNAAKPEETSDSHSPPPLPAAAGIPGFCLQV
jgi:hypothetical protein